MNLDDRWDRVVEEIDWWRWKNKDWAKSEIA